MHTPVVLTALYVPGDRPDRFDKAAGSGADVVLLDLEDAVAPQAKPRARAAVAQWLSARAAAPPALDVGVQVRINAVGSTWLLDDLAMLRSVAPLPGIRVPKVTSAADLDAVLSGLGGDADLHVIIESALGVEASPQIARHRCVATVGLGEADLASDLGTTGDEALGWVRSRLVVAARAAGLPAPMQSVYPYLGDLEALDRSCRVGRCLGLLGRAAIHPQQLPVIARAYRPGATELAWAEEALHAAGDAGDQGRGAVVLASGAMVDRAMLPRARQIMAVEAAAARTLTLLDGR